MSSAAEGQSESASPALGPALLGLGNHAKHVFVFTAAGKPVFSRYNDEEPSLCTLYAALTVLMQMPGANSSSTGSSGAENVNRPVLRSIKSHRSTSRRSLRSHTKASAASSSPLNSYGKTESVQTRIHFYGNGDMRYVMVVRGSAPTALESAAVCEAQLQYVHRFILSVVPTVKEILVKRPGHDVRSMFSPADFDVLRALIDRFESDLSFLREAVPIYSAPDVPVEVKHWLQEALLSVCVKHSAGDVLPEGLLYSFITSTDHMVVSQPHAGMTALCASDTLLLMHIVKCLRRRQEGEAWAPVCLPGFNSSGYVWCYVGELGDISRGLNLEGSGNFQQLLTSGNHDEVQLVHISVCPDDFPLLSHSARTIAYQLCSRSTLSRASFGAAMRQRTVLEAVASLQFGCESSSSLPPYTVLSASVVVAGGGTSRSLQTIPHTSRVSTALLCPSVAVRMVDRAVQLLKRSLVSFPFAFVRSSECAVLVLHPAVPLVVQMCQAYYQPGSIIGDAAAPVAAYNFGALLSAAGERGVLEVIMVLKPNIAFTDALGLATHTIRAISMPK